MYSLPHVFSNYSGHYEDLQPLAVGYLANRRPFSRSALANIRGPVRLVHFTGDLAYTVEDVEELASDLEAAGVDVKTAIIPGACHNGSTIGASRECVGSPCDDFHAHTTYML
jgi:dienelactone hydrolase